MTSKEQEFAELRRWKARRQNFNYRYFDELVHNEFTTPDNHYLWLGRGLRNIIAIALDRVPYYRSLFHELGLAAGDVKTPGDLHRIPVLGRQDVLDHAKSLLAESLPQNVRVWGCQSSSGTTGQPVKVYISTFQNLFYSILWHRQARWFRMNPMATLCDIRFAPDIARTRDGKKNPDGNIVRHPRWRYLGQFFQTGPECGFNLTNEAQQQIQWIQDIRPDYIMTDPGLLEELALANHGRSPADSIKALLGVASQLTDSMREQLDRFYGVPIHQTYGLNEIGKVAFRCDEGRYHVNVEHCYVEIVDQHGRPCAAGEEGRIIVTALRNPVMPLIRYDTGDLGTAVDGPCPCGRTLPAFGNVVGRFRRYAGLPAGTRERFNIIRRTIRGLSDDDLLFLRQFQLHQFRDNRFELRMRTEGAVPHRFRELMQTAWQNANIQPPAKLDIVEVESISRSPSGKILDFTSDYYEDAFVRERSE